MFPPAFAEEVIEVIVANFFSPIAVLPLFTPLMVSVIMLPLVSVPVTASVSVGVSVCLSGSVGHRWPRVARSLYMRQRSLQWRLFS